MMGRPRAPRGPEARTKFERLLDKYCRLGLTVYAFLLVKNVLIAALDLQSAAHLRWLDCYLLGRLQLASRIPQASRYCTIAIDLAMMSNRLLIMAFADEIRLFGKQATRLLRAHAGLCEWRARHFLLDRRVTNPVSCSSEPIFRPHRPIDRPRWERRLMNSIHLGAAAFWLLYYFGCITLISQMFVTRRGFELLYPHCVAWILQQQARNTSSHSSIYRPTPGRTMRDIAAEEIPLHLPLVDLVPATPYHLVRIPLEFFEFCLANFDIMVLFSLHLHFIICLSFDLIIYAASIRRRLETVAEQLALLPRFSAYNNAHFSARRKRQSVLEPQLVALQGNLLDYFRLVRAYNPYVGAVSLLHLGPWLFYAFMIFARYLQSGRLKVVLDNGVHFEFVFLFCACLAPILVGMACEFVLASQARRMYPQIGRVMALDDGSSHTKARWITLTRFYRPKSLHCFTMLNTVELTWLYGLKLFSWVLSALFVMRSL